MITTQTALALAKSLRLDWHCRHRRGNQTKGKPSRAKSLSESGDARPDSGLDTETQVLSSSGRGRSFFLTSLFIELIDDPYTMALVIRGRRILYQSLRPFCSRKTQPKATPSESKALPNHGPNSQNGSMRLRQRFFWRRRRLQLRADLPAVASGMRKGQVPSHFSRNSCAGRSANLAMAASPRGAPPDFSAQPSLEKTSI